MKCCNNYGSLNLGLDMFETLEIADVGIPDIFSDQGVHSWWYVQRRLHTHWFHVTYSEKYVEDGEEFLLSNIMFFSLVEHLIRFAQLQDKTIEQIYIITPNHLNGSNHWKMEPLKEIWKGHVPETMGQTAHIFKLNNGKEYVVSGLGTVVSNIINKKCIFKI